MKFYSFSATALLSAALLAAAPAVHAQQSSSTQVAKAGAGKKVAKKVAKKKGAVAAGAAAAVAAAALLPEASAEQLQAVERVHLGSYQCDFGQTLAVQPTQGHPGFVDVRFDGQVITMKPVLTSTGSLRIEDMRGERMLLQIANKSMLMDQRVGRRLVDGCVHAAQQGEFKPTGLLN